MRVRNVVVEEMLPYHVNVTHASTTMAFFFVS
jgi:hypothetical protein